MGKYEYQQLPMGLYNSPDIFQENISEHFVGLDTVRVYIDDLLHVIKGSWTEHLTVLEEMFTRLHKAGLKVSDVNTHCVYTDEYFRHIFLEDIGTVAQNHGELLILVLTSLGDDYAKFF